MVGTHTWVSRSYCLPGKRMSRGSRNSSFWRLKSTLVWLLLHVLLGINCLLPICRCRFNVRSASVPPPPMSLVVLKVSSCWKEPFTLSLAAITCSRVRLCVLVDHDYIDWGELVKLSAVAPHLYFPSAERWSKSRFETNGKLISESHVSSHADRLLWPPRVTGIALWAVVLFTTPLPFVICKGLRGFYMLSMNNKAS